MNRSISPDVFKGTPTISVIDNRGLAVRSVQYNRLSASSALECLITRSTYNSVGQLSGAHKSLSSNYLVVPEALYHQKIQWVIFLSPQIQKYAQC